MAGYGIRCVRLWEGQVSQLSVLIFCPCMFSDKLIFVYDLLLSG